MINQNETYRWTEALRELFRGQASIILLSVPVLLTVWRYYGSSDFFNDSLLQFFNVSGAGPSGVLYSFVSSALLLLIVPIIIIRLFLKMPLKSFGFQWGDKSVGFAIVGVLFPIIAILMLLPTSRQPDFIMEYPLFRQAGENLPALALYEISYGLYYLSWEFFFRGYMLFGLKDILGNAQSILIQTIPSTLMHIGKPDGEIFASILAGLIFGYIAIRTKSIIYVFLLHWLIGITLDIFIIFI